MDERPPASTPGDAGEDAAADLIDDAAQKASVRDRAAVLRARARELEAKAQERLEVEQRSRGWVHSLILVFQADRNRGGGLLAGGLAYRFFLWELPAMLFVVSVLGLIDHLGGEPPGTIANNSGMAAEVGRVIADAAGASGSSWWWLLIVGLVLMIWAGRGMVKALWLIAQIVWQRRAPRSSTVKASLIFSGVALGSFAIPLGVTSVIRGFFVVDIVGWIVASAAVTAMTVAAMIGIPRGGRPWVAIVPGTVAFVVSLRLISSGSAIYFSKKLGSVDDLYGAMGVAIVTQLWLYIVARLYVLGQFLNATLAGVSPGRLEGDLSGDSEEQAAPPP